MSDERTLAAEVRELFQMLGREPNRYLHQVIAEAANTDVGTVQFYGVVAGMKAKCDRLSADIRVSRLKEASKNLYVGAVATFANYLTINSILSAQNHQIRNEIQAFQYLTLVDDFLEPSDSRDIPEGFLDGIKKQAEAMLTGLKSSDLDARLKVFLEKQIREFIWSIETFHLLGIEGLTKAWGAMAAEIARSQGMQGSRSPAAKAWYKKALPILGAIGIAVTAVSAKVEDVDNALTHGGNIVKLLAGGDADEQAAKDEADDKNPDSPKAANSQ